MPALLPGGVKLVEKEKRTLKEEAPYSPGLGGLQEGSRELQIGKYLRKEVLKNDKPYLMLSSRKS